MSPIEAAEAIKLLKPKMVIPMHFGTFPALSGSPEALKKALPKSVPTKVVALKAGEVLAYSGIFRRDRTHPSGNKLERELLMSRHWLPNAGPMVCPALIGDSCNWNP